MSEIVIWHNPRCSKSRATLALLEARGVKPVVRLYQEDIPDRAELQAAIAALGIETHGLVRFMEAEAKEAGLSKASPPDALLTAMAATPKLIERPVVFAGGKARIGRPPEQVLEIL